MGFIFILVCVIYLVAICVLHIKFFNTDFKSSLILIQTNNDIQVPYEGRISEDDRIIEESTENELLQYINTDNNTDNNTDILEEYIDNTNNEVANNEIANEFSNEIGNQYSSEIDTDNEYNFPKVPTHTNKKTHTSIKPDSLTNIEVSNTEGIQAYDDFNSAYSLFK